jgi:hypothetical protein
LGEREVDTSNIFDSAELGCLFPFPLLFTGEKKSTFLGSARQKSLMTSGLDNTFLTVREQKIIYDGRK